MLHDLSKSKAPFQIVKDEPLVVGQFGRQPTQQERTTGTWDEPDTSLLEDRRGDLPDFPLHLLPAGVQQWIVPAARGAGVTLAYVAMPLLGMASSLIGTSRRIRASQSWSEPMTLWTAVIANSGAGKSPGARVTRRVLKQIESNLKGKLADMQREHESKVQQAKAAKKKWETEVAEAVEAGIKPPDKPAGACDIGPFVAPRLCVSDATVERLAALHEARPCGLLFFADELARLFLNMRRYSAGQDNEFWLEAWNGDSFTVERQGRPPLILDHLLIGITGGFQPDKLVRSFEGDDDGMYARFLFAWPDEPEYAPLTNDVGEVEPEIVNAFTRLMNLTDDKTDFVPKSVWLTDDAIWKLEQFRKQLHVNRKGLDGREREWCSKGVTHVLRLAGTLAFLEWAMMGGAEPQNIGEKYVTDAMQLWTEYFLPHGRAAMRQMETKKRRSHERRLLEWIVKNNKLEVSLMNVRREALGQAIDADATRKMLDGLVRAGWLRLRSRKTGGRDNHRWEVNDILFQVLSAESAGSAETST